MVTARILRARLRWLQQRGEIGKQLPSPRRQCLRVDLQTTRARIVCRVDHPRQRIPRPLPGATVASDVTLVGREPDAERDGHTDDEHEIRRAVAHPLAQRRHTRAIRTASTANGVTIVAIPHTRCGQRRSPISACIICSLGEVADIRRVLHRRRSVRGGTCLPSPPRRSASPRPGSRRAVFRVPARCARGATRSLWCRFPRTFRPFPTPRVVVAVRARPRDR